MGHRIAVLRPCGTDPKVSNLTQCGTPMEIYDTPANIFTAGFMGTPKMNLMRARLDADGRTLLALGTQIPVSTQFRDAASRRKGGEVTLGIRAEHIGAPGEVDFAGGCDVQAVVEILEPLGHEVIVHTIVQGQPLSGRLRSHATMPAPGDTILLKINAEAMHLFDPATEDRLR